MLDCCRMRPSFYAEGGRPQQRDRILQILQGTIEITVARRTEDCFVKQPIQTRQLTGIALTGLEAIEQIGESLDLGRRGVLFSQTVGGSLKHLAHDIEFQRFDKIETANH